MTIEVETIKIRDAKQEVPGWLTLVQQGVEVILTDEGRPLARISPIQPNSVRIPGLNRGEIEATDDFDAPLSESFWLGE